MSQDTLNNTILDFHQALQEFEHAWHNPAHTRFELPAVDVNAVLREKYRLDPPRTITRSMVWDMEMKKAWDPLSYIPYVVSEGRSWGRCKLRDDSDRFYRSSIQRAWIKDTSGRVLEDVYVNHEQQKIIFLGRSRFETDGEVVNAEKDFQPLFHVEHAASGPESDPYNLWRIVILTEKPDDRFKKPFEDMVLRAMLPGFLEIYITKDLGLRLSAK